MDTCNWLCKYLNGIMDDPSGQSAQELFRYWGDRPRQHMEVFAIRTLPQAPHQWVLDAESTAKLMSSSGAKPARSSWVSFGSDWGARVTTPIRYRYDPRLMHVSVGVFKARVLVPWQGGGRDPLNGSNILLREGKYSGAIRLFDGESWLIDRHALLVAMLMNELSRNPNGLSDKTRSLFTRDVPAVQLREDLLQTREAQPFRDALTAVINHPNALELFDRLVKPRRLHTPVPGMLSVLVGCGFFK